MEIIDENVRHTLPLTTAPEVRFVLSITILRIKWDLELSAFILVDAICLEADPFSKSSIKSAALCASLITEPVTTTIPYESINMKLYI